MAQNHRKAYQFPFRLKFWKFYQISPKNGLFICQSVRFWGKKFPGAGVLTRHGIRGIGSHFTKKLWEKLWNQPFFEVEKKPSEMGLHFGQKTFFKSLKSRGVPFQKKIWENCKSAISEVEKKASENGSRFAKNFRGEKKKNGKISRFFEGEKPTGYWVIHKCT